jgi:hypothetical protein
MRKARREGWPSDLNSRLRCWGRSLHLLRRTTHSPVHDSNREPIEATAKPGTTSTVDRARPLFTNSHQGLSDFGVFLNHCCTQRLCPSSPHPSLLRSHIPVGLAQVPDTGRRSSAGTRDGCRVRATAHFLGAASQKIEENTGICGRHYGSVGAVSIAVRARTQTFAITKSQEGPCAASTHPPTESDPAGGRKHQARSLGNGG